MLSAASRTLYARGELIELNPKVCSMMIGMERAMADRTPTSRIVGQRRLGCR